jgi:membrane peptidoglycan carboxypeptidase
MVKFRHSSKGMTSGPMDKIRQIIGGSLWAYRKGPNTIDTRKEIVREYFNGMPLGAAKGYGEINGIGKGMWAWFGKNIDQVMSDLQMNETDQDMLYRKAKTLKEALSLIIATRYPSLYLQKDHTILEKTVNTYLRLLETDGIISIALKKAALTTPLEFRRGAPIPPPLSLVERKGTDSIRIKLLNLLGIETLYELDRLDMAVDTTFDFDVQQKVNNILKSLYVPEFLEENGFLAPYLLNKGDPGGVIYSFALFESRPEGNLLRIQADTLNKPLSITTGIKLELGSTAKLRTLASYLMVIDHLYGCFSEKDRSDLLKKKTQVYDPLSKWVLDYLLYHPKAAQEEILKASLQRSISGSPHQAFFTGGGMHTFKNFKKDQDNRVFTIEEGLCQSVNLVFIRLMKEVVDYYTANLGYDVKALLSETNNPERLPLLREAMELESVEFLRKYYRIYAGKTYEESFAILCQSSEHPLRNWVILYLKENPEATLEQLITAAKSHFQEKA